MNNEGDQNLKKSMDFRMPELSRQSEKPMKDMAGIKNTIEDCRKEDTVEKLFETHQ